jgi:hypothetical protein
VPVNKFIAFVSICSTFALLAFSWSVSAQKVSKSASDQARERFERGKVAYSQGDHELAIREWEAAYGIDPRPQIKYNLAQAYERLGKLNEAVKALELYLEKAGSEDSEYLADARAELASIQTRLSRTGVVLQGGPEGASIFIDGQSWGLTPRPDKIALSPGNHRVTVKQEGFRDFISDISVPAGQVIEVAVSLEPDTHTAAAKPAEGAAAQAGLGSSAAQPSPSEARDKALGWYIAAGALGGVTVGSLIWVINRSGAVSDCRNPKSTQACLNESTLKSERTAALVTTAIFGVGAIAAVVVGIIQSAGNVHEQPAATACSPSLQGLGCSIGF